MTPNSDTVTRFAPSPTGNLHVGNIRTALHNWMYARKHGGRFVLRLDDTDQARSDEAFVTAIRHDLGWLGLTPDGEARQSERFHLYDAHFAALEQVGRVYRCYETPEELDLRRKVLLGRGLPPVYERGALALGEDDHAAHAAAGRAPHWRFKLDHDAPIAWDDLIRGPQHFDPKLLSDPVIRRADGSWLYMLPSAIDDIDMRVTHVVRGEDHVSNTAAQIQMFEALGAAPPTFAHEALLVGSEGKLSKRLGSLGADHFRELGIEPIALVALLARIGTSEPVIPVNDVAPLIESFDFAHFGRAPARFDDDELKLLNQKIIHGLDYDAVAARLPADIGAAGWEAIRPNLHTVREAADIWSCVTGPIAPPEFDADTRVYLATAADQAAAIDWTSDPWHALTGALKSASDRKGKMLFLPLRQALTGRESGPDMAALLPLIGSARAIERLRAAAQG